MCECMRMKQECMQVPVCVGREGERQHERRASISKFPFGSGPPVAVTTASQRNPSINPKNVSQKHDARS